VLALPFTHHHGGQKARLCGASHSLFHTSSWHAASLSKGANLSLGMSLSFISQWLDDSLIYRPLSHDISSNKTTDAAGQYGRFRNFGRVEPLLISKTYPFIRLTQLTLILLTWKIWWAPNNASRWQMGFNLAFKGLNPSLWDTNGVTAEFMKYRMRLKHDCEWWICKDLKGVHYGLITSILPTGMWRDKNCEEPCTKNPLLRIWTTIFLMQVKGFHPLSFLILR